MDQGLAHESASMPWPAPPWSGDQVATLALLLSMAEVD